MQAADVMMKSLEQSQRYVDNALSGLTAHEFAWKPGPECNSIAFIVWHTARVEDFMVNRMVQRGKELYEVEGWREKLGTPPDAGYQYTDEKLQAWPAPDMETLKGYAMAVREKTIAFLKTAADEKLAEVPRPDRSPDTIGIILGRLSTEIALHAGQVCYLRGVQRGLDK